MKVTTVLLADGVTVSVDLTPLRACERRGERPDLALMAFAMGTDEELARGLSAAVVAALPILRAGAEPTMIVTGFKLDYAHDGPRIVIDGKVSAGAGPEQWNNATTSARAAVRRALECLTSPAE